MKREMVDYKDFMEEVGEGRLKDFCVEELGAMGLLIFIKTKTQQDATSQSIARWSLISDKAFISTVHCTKDQPYLCWLNLFVRSRSRASESYFSFYTSM